MIQKILDLNYILKFDETYFDIWKHRLTLLAKTEKGLVYHGKYKDQTYSPNGSSNSCWKSNSHRCK
jgi:hypothetical protein